MAGFQHFTAVGHHGQGPDHRKTATVKAAAGLSLVFDSKPVNDAQPAADCGRAYPEAFTAGLVPGAVRFPWLP